MNVFIITFLINIIIDKHDFQFLTTVFLPISAYTLFPILLQSRLIVSTNTNQLIWSFLLENLVKLAKSLSFALENLVKVAKRLSFTLENLVKLAKRLHQSKYILTKSIK